MHESRHVATAIAAPADAVYAFARDPRNLVRWAAGLARSQVTQVDGAWVVTSPMGEVTIAFTPPNDLGVLDHRVTLPGGESVDNPLRVIANGEGCDVVFTVRRRDGMSEADLEADAAAVAADLETLRALCES